MALTVATCSHVVWYVSKNACSFDVRKEYPSPSGRKVAGVLEGNCGATVGFFWNVSIRSANEGYAADHTGNPVHGVLLPKGAADLEFRWRGDATLVVRGSNLPETTTVVNGTTVEFRPLVELQERIGCGRFKSGNGPLGQDLLDIHGTRIFSSSQGCAGPTFFERLGTNWSNLFTWRRGKPNIKGLPLPPGMKGPAAFGQLLGWLTGYQPAIDAIALWIGQTYRRLV